MECETVILLYYFMTMVLVGWIVNIYSNKMLEAARLNTIQEVVFAPQSDSENESGEESNESEEHEEHSSESENEVSDEKVNNEAEAPKEVEMTSTDGLRIRRPEII